MIGSYDWEFVASGAGGPITASERVTATPAALYAGAIVLVVDLAVLTLRLSRRRRREPSRAVRSWPAPAAA